MTSRWSRDFLSRVFLKQKCKMTGEWCVFKFLRRSVDGKHLMSFQSKTSDFFLRRSVAPNTNLHFLGPWTCIKTVYGISTVKTYSEDVYGLCMALLLPWLWYNWRNCRFARNVRVNTYARVKWGNSYGRPELLLTVNEQPVAGSLLYSSCPLTVANLEMSRSS